MPARPARVPSPPPHERVPACPHPLLRPLRPRRPRRPPGQEAASRSRPGVAERSYPYADFSELAGPLQEPAEDPRVRFEPVSRGAARVRAWLLVTAALLFEVLFLRSEE